MKSIKLKVTYLYYISLVKDNQNLLGILCVILAGALFSCNDVAIKWLSNDYPLHQIILFRSLLGLIFTISLLVPLQGGLKILKTNFLSYHLTRGFLVFFANLLFFMSLPLMNYAEATAVFFIAPVIITLLSIIFLNEKIGPHRWAAIVLGFIGVIIILKPTSNSIQIVAILPAMAAVCYATLHIFTRKMGSTEKASTMAVYIQITLIFMSSLLGILVGDGRFEAESPEAFKFLLRPWVTPSFNDAVVILCLGVFSAFGGFFISQGYRISQPSRAAPFEYVSLILSVIWGIFLFNEFPDLLAYSGIVLIASGGIYIFIRESYKTAPNVSKRSITNYK